MWLDHGPTTYTHQGVREGGRGQSGKQNPSNLRPTTSKTQDPWWPITSKTHSHPRPHNPTPTRNPRPPKANLKPRPPKANLEREREKPHHERKRGESMKQRGEMIEEIGI